jgi:hypothetical protein
VDTMTRWLPLLLLSAACAAPPAADPPAAPEAPPATDRVALAMSAAPAAIASAATIMDFDSTGAMVQLRPGTNGWMCLPDENPAAPGDAPICVDGAWQAWLGAYMAKETPRIAGIGVSYMLQGGPAASNTDPFAAAPPAGQDWLRDGPHVMIIVPDPRQLDAFPSEHGTGGPYVMWKGTPYAHLMVPVAGR